MLYIGTYFKVNDLEVGMNNRSRVNLGDDIKNIIQDALSNGDFKRLNHDVENIVRSALDEVRRSVDWKQVNQRSWSNQTISKRVDVTNNYQDKNEMDAQALKEERLNKDRNNYHAMNIPNNTHVQSKPALKSTKFAIPKGQVSGILLTVFGTVGGIAFGIGVFVLALLGYFIGSKGLFYSIALGISPFFIVSVILSSNGSKIRKRLKRFQRYVVRMGGRDYCLISELSSAAGLDKRATVKDLQKMISIGMFPEGHIDDRNTYFMLNNQCYEQYMKLQENVRMKDLEEGEKKKHQPTNQDSRKSDKSTINDKLDPEIRKAIDEGRRFVIEIKDANIAIPGEEISRKLDRLEEVTGKIYDFVEIHPDKFPEIKKFAEYFLPTTLKLLDAYSKFDNQPVQGDNISSAKKEIEETMDTINLAFENLLDSLFEDAAMDISTDISVLETMFAQEGLTGNDMSIKK